MQKVWLPYFLLRRFIAFIAFSIFSIIKLSLVEYPLDLCIGVRRFRYFGLKN
mgnify:CR=1 FL=1